MSDTQVNAYRLELAQKESQLAALRGEVDFLKKRIDSLAPEESKPDASVESTEDAGAPKEEAKK